VRPHPARCQARARITIAACIVSLVQVDGHVVCGQGRRLVPFWQARFSIYPSFILQRNVLHEQLIILQELKSLLSASTA
jgi:hypothetical protein